MKKKNNGRPLIPQMAKAPGGGTGIMKTGSSNSNLGTGHNSLTQRMVNHTGVILMDTASVPPWTLSWLNNVMIMMKLKYMLVPLKGCPKGLPLLRQT